MKGITLGAGKQAGQGSSVVVFLATKTTTKAITAAAAAHTRIGGRRRLYWSKRTMRWRMCEQ